MNLQLIEMLNAIWRQQPNKPMLTDEMRSLDVAQFSQALSQCQSLLCQWQPKCVALIADNSIDWVLIDMACQSLDVAFLPLPIYFSVEQMRHSLHTAGCDLLLIDPQIDNPLTMALTGQPATDTILGYSVNALSPQLNNQLPAATAKITFTSGSTGAPKGVCLSQAHQWQVAAALQAAVGLQTDKHLCILPLTTLLENVAGVYAALLNGATVALPSLKTLGFNGNGSIDFSCLLAKIIQERPATLITSPEILAAMVGAAEQGWEVPDSLKYLAVGGARVAPGLLQRAFAVGIPTYQGYGLSECASVVSLNTVNDHDTATMGRILSHSHIAIESGEVIVIGACFLGYAGDQTSWGQKRFATGDLGYLDEHGYLTITGRKKNLLISSYGRNINPEWLEAELLAAPILRQAFVFGDDRPFCVAALLAANGSISGDDITEWVAQVNQALPDYAQIKAWFLLPQIITPATGLLTNNGRPKRAQLQAHLQFLINPLYQTNTVAVLAEELAL